MHRLLSTAAPPLPAPPVEADAYAEGYAAGTAHAVSHVVRWLRAAAAGAPPDRQREAVALTGAADIFARFQHLADLAPDPTADRAQIAALGQRGDQGR